MVFRMHVFRSFFLSMALGGTFLNLSLFASIHPPSLQSCGEDGSCAIGVKTLVFFDVARERPIITEVYYPAEQKKAPLEGVKDTDSEPVVEIRNAPIAENLKKTPLIVLSHGYPGDRYSFAWLQKILAANGYIVAVPDHFGSTHYMHRAEDSLRRWDRPKDISYVIDNMVKSSFFKGHIDTNKIGFIGYSYGGLTGVWLAGGVARNYPIPNMATSNAAELDSGTTQAIIESIDFSKAKKSYEDKRIKAALLISPAYGFAFDKEGLNSIEIPILIVAAREDKTFPLKQNAQFYADNIKSSGIKIIEHSADHDAFLSEEECSGKRGCRIEIEGGQPFLERDQVHDEVSSLAIKFFNRYIKDVTKNRNGNCLLKK